MGQMSNSAVGSYMADYQYRTEQTKKNENTDKSGKTEKKVRPGGRTIGDVQLSEKAAKYYEKLKAKYGNMDFVIVSADKKEEAERNKGMYKSSKELLVLIDADKIEKMAEDESYRKKYESILSGATSKMNQMKQRLGSRAKHVRSFGMTFDDNGTASLFAVIDRSLAKQRERIADKKEKIAEDRKDAAKEAAAERAEKWRNPSDKIVFRDDDEVTAADARDPVTVTAPTWDELFQKIDHVIGGRQDFVRTDAEKAVGGSFDYSL